MLSIAQSVGNHHVPRAVSRQSLKVYSANFACTEFSREFALPRFLGSSLRSALLYRSLTGLGMSLTRLL